ncbi:Plasmid stabilization system (modular protein) [Syntrophobacter sp. SbD1]|nr:Plasmid stabilization system (modular protein) [Syntrophobacter sp. SbD1]
MPVIIKLPRAKSDLVEIWDYIADDSDAHADAFVDMIDLKLLALASNPGIGRARDELAEGLWSFAVGSPSVHSPLLSVQTVYLFFSPLRNRPPKSSPFSNHQTMTNSLSAHLNGSPPVRCAQE